MIFDEQGFLSPVMEEFCTNNYNINKQIFDYYYRLNQFATNLMNKMEITKENIQQVIGTQLLIKIKRGFESIAILYKYGLNTEAVTVK